MFISNKHEGKAHADDRKYYKQNEKSIGSAVQAGNDYIDGRIVTRDKLIGLSPNGVYNTNTASVTVKLSRVKANPLEA